MKEQKRNEFKNGKLVETVISPESIEQKPELDGALYYFGPDLLILVEPSGKTFEWPWKAASFNETTREMNIITGLQKPVTIPIRLTDDSLSARVVQDLDYLRSEQDWEYVDRSERPSR